MAYNELDTFDMNDDSNIQQEDGTESDYSLDYEYLGPHNQITETNKTLIPMPRNYLILRVTKVSICGTKIHTAQMTSLGNPMICVSQVL